MKKILSLVCVLCLFLAFLPHTAAARTYDPIIKVGLNYDSKALPAANLQNYSGMDTGYAFGYFDEMDLSRELELINTNIKAVHILTKLFLLEFKEKNCGKILNVASAAGFMPEGPMLSTYYGTKAYVLSLSRGIAKELKKSGSAVTVSALCPGPVKTEFDAVAGVDFQGVGMSAKKCAEIGISGMLKGKTVIIPGFLMKAGKFFTKILPDGVIGEFAYHFQKAKRKD